MVGGTNTGGGGGANGFSNGGPQTVISGGPGGPGLVVVRYPYP
jgi:hypothetical protein